MRKRRQPRLPTNGPAFVGRHHLVGRVEAAQMHLDLVAAAGEDRRAAAGTEEPPAVFVRFAVDRHRILGKHRRGVEQRAVMLAAVEAVTDADPVRSEEHTSELQTLMSISYAVFCLK